MLVLSRRMDERVTIRVPASTEEQFIELVIVDLRKDATRIGFTADRKVEILRNEVIGPRTHDYKNQKGELATRSSIKKS